MDRSWHYNLILTLFKSWRTTLYTFLFYPFTLWQIDRRLDGKIQIHTLVISITTFILLLITIFKFPLTETVQDDFSHHVDFLNQDTELGYEVPDGYKAIHQDRTEQECVEYFNKHHSSSFNSTISSLDELVNHQANGSQNLFVCPQKIEIWKKAHTRLSSFGYRLGHTMSCLLT